MLGLLAIIVVVLLFMGAGAHWVALPALIAGFVFVAFWVVLLKMLIGFGRWLMGMPPGPPHRVPAARRPIGPQLYPAPPSRTCSDPRCGRVNVTEARFCAQCGRSLGRAT
jgi:hypothetical protein